MAASPNTAGYARRMSAVEGILSSLGLQWQSVSTIAYDENVPFHFNNFIYRVDLTNPVTPDSFIRRLPGTTPPPASGTSTVAFRFSNPQAGGMNNANRVENIVASQFLARSALLSAGLGPIVPGVYAWGSYRPSGPPREADFGWILDEFKPGEDLDGHFPSLTSGEKRAVIGQMADILAALQKISIPEAVDKFGSMTFDSEGNIVSGQMPLVKGGPWDNYADFWMDRLLSQLKAADESPVVKGWSAGGLRRRIDTFIERGGVAKLLKAADVSQRIFVHGDFTMNNVLYDAQTKTITGLLDFDWSSVCHPCHEFFNSVHDLGGNTHPNDELLQEAVLTGDFNALPGCLSEEANERWQVAKDWDAAVTARRAIKPSLIAGIRDLEQLRMFDELLAPFPLTNEVLLSTWSAEKLDKVRSETEARLLDWLASQSL